MEGNDALTPREREVLELMKQRWRNKGIADALSIDERAVETHVAHVLHKLGYHDRNELWADGPG